MKNVRRVHVYGAIGLALLLVSAGGAALLVNGPGASASPRQAESASPLQRVVCFGHVDVDGGVASLYPLVPGRVNSIAVKENSVVAKGESLLKLDDSLPQLRVKEAEADVNAAREQLGQARSLPEQHRLKVIQQKAVIEAVEQKMDGARSLLMRKKALAKIEQLTQQDVRAAEALVKELEAVERAERGKLHELELNDPSAGVKRAEADVDAKEARLEQARRVVRECELRAPTDGIVLRVLVHAGEVLGPQPTQPAVLFCPKTPRIVRVEVEQEYASRVEVGQAAFVQDDTTTSVTWRGKVLRMSDWYTHRRSILQEPFQFNDVRTLECIVAVDPGQVPLRIGQRVRVVIGQNP